MHHIQKYRSAVCCLSLRGRYLVGVQLSATEQPISTSDRQLRTCLPANVLTPGSLDTRGLSYAPTEFEVLCWLDAGKYILVHMCLYCCMTESEAELCENVDTRYCLYSSSLLLVVQFATMSHEQVNKMTNQRRQLQSSQF